MRSRMEFGHSCASPSQASNSPKSQLPVCTQSVSKSALTTPAHRLLPLLLLLLQLIPQMADASTSNSTPRPSRKAKDRDGDTTDLYDKMIALQRKQHAMYVPQPCAFPGHSPTGYLSFRPSRTRDRPERPLTRPSSPPPAPVQLSPPRKSNPPPPQVVVSRTDSMEASEEQPRRKRPANMSPRAHHASAHSTKGKLYNPEVDPIPTMRRTAEPELLSDNGSSSYAPRNAAPSQDRGQHHGRLFDHKRDDPVRFHVLARPNPSNGNRPTPTPKSSGEYVSASSTSSYAHSITSSNFTLSSTTDGSSASSAVFDQQNREHASSGAFAAQLKKLYRWISNLESKLLLKEEGKDLCDDVRISVKRPNDSSESAETEKEKWKKFVADHKRYSVRSCSYFSSYSSPCVVSPSLCTIFSD